MNGEETAVTEPLQRDGNVTLTATPEPFSFSSSLQRSSETVRPGKKRLLQNKISLSIRTHGSFCPQLAAFWPFSLRLCTLLRLGEPTEAMRLPQLNTCHPPRRRLGGERGLLFMPHSSAFSVFCENKQSKCMSLNLLFSVDILYFLR